jgi:hypothetical protein
MLKSAFFCPSRLSTGVINRKFRPVFINYLRTDKSYQKTDCRGYLKIPTFYSASIVILQKLLNRCRSEDIFIVSITKHYIIKKSRFFIIIFYIFRKKITFGGKCAFGGFCHGWYIKYILSQRNSNIVVVLGSDVNITCRAYTVNHKKSFT